MCSGSCCCQIYSVLQNERRYNEYRVRKTFFSQINSPTAFIYIHILHALLHPSLFSAVLLILPIHAAPCLFLPPAGTEYALQDWAGLALSCNVHCEISPNVVTTPAATAVKILYSNAEALGIVRFSCCVDAVSVKPHMTQSAVVGTSFGDSSSLCAL